MQAVEPGLHQGCGGGQGDEGQAEAQGQGEQDLGCGMAAGIEVEAFQPEAQGQGQKGEDEQAHLGGAGAAGGEAVGHQMRPGVAGEQGGLEEEQAGGPDRHRAAEAGGEDASGDGLHLEEQEGTEERGEGEERHASC